VPAPLKDQICFTLYATSMAVNRMYKPMLDAMGITYPQYLVLNVLGEQDGQTVGAIAGQLDLESSTVTPPIKRLEQAGLVSRQRGQADERQVLVFLTDTGRETLAQSNCLNQSLLERSGMGLPEIDLLTRELQMLRDLLVEGQPAQEEAGPGSAE
jgi:DNA-binding MarR family transcriptional regulator